MDAFFCGERDQQAMIDAVEGLMNDAIMGQAIAVRAGAEIRKDLAGSQAASSQRMLSLCKRYEDDLMPLPLGYTQIHQLLSNTTQTQLRAGMIVLLFALPGPPSFCVGLRTKKELHR